MKSIRVVYSGIGVIFVLSAIIILGVLMSFHDIRLLKSEIIETSEEMAVLRV